MQYVITILILKVKLRQNTVYVHFLFRRCDVLAENSTCNTSFFNSREHPIGDKSFQTYIRQQSEISAHSIWSVKDVTDSAEESIGDAKQQSKGKPHM